MVEAGDSEEEKENEELLDYGDSPVHYFHDDDDDSTDGGFGLKVGAESTQEVAETPPAPTEQIAADDIILDVDPVSVFDPSAVDQDQDVEEGEIVHNMTKEELAKLFGISVEEFDAPVVEKNVSPHGLNISGNSDVLEDDQVAEKSNYKTDGMIFEEFDEEFDEEIEMLSQDLRKEQAVDEDDSIKEEKKAWFKKSKKVIEFTKLSPLKYYKKPNIRGLGDAISVAYQGKIKKIAVRGDFGVQYFNNLFELKSMPFYLMQQLCKKPLLYAQDDKFNRELWDFIVRQSKVGFFKFKPQLPTLRISRVEIDP